MPANRLVEKEKVAIYVNTLFQAASDEGGREKAVEIRDQVDALAGIMRGNSDLVETLNDSTLAPDQRAQIARNVFTSCEPALVDVLAVMAERGDIKLFNRVATAYERTVSEKFNVTIVDVTTVVELDDHLREVITNKAAKDFGTDIVRWQLESARIELKK